MKRLAVLACLLVAAPALAGPKKPERAPEARRYACQEPAALWRMLQIGVRLPALGGFSEGLGAPVSHVYILTAAHVLGPVPAPGDKEPEVYWRAHDGRTGRARVLWRDDIRELPDGRVVGDDLAMLVVDPGQLTEWIEIAPEPPVYGEELFWRVKLARAGVGVGCGPSAGVDGEADLNVFGLFHPGTSGGGVLNGAGQLVGVVSMAGKWMDRDTTRWREACKAATCDLETALNILQERIDVLERRDMMPSSLGVQPVTGRIPERPKR